jgi:hypothetical protein
MANKYVQNTHIAVINCVGKDKKTLIKRFGIEAFDSLTGQRIDTGFTSVTEEELKRLREESPLFVYFADKKRKLIVHDRLPDFAMTPLDAARETAKENAELKSKIAELEAQLKEKAKPKKEKDA